MNSTPTNPPKTAQEQQYSLQRRNENCIELCKYGSPVIALLPADMADDFSSEQEAVISAVSDALNSHAAVVAEVKALREALTKADALEVAANALACARHVDERNRLTVKLATAQGEYREARSLLAPPANLHNTPANSP